MTSVSVFDYRSRCHKEVQIPEGWTKAHGSRVLKGDKFLDMIALSEENRTVFEEVDEREVDEIFHDDTFGLLIRKDSSA